MPDWKAVGTWFVGWFKMSLNILKIISKQEETNKRLNKIEETIRLPQYQLTELQKIQAIIDLQKTRHEEEIKKLEMGTKEEIEGHRAKIDILQTENKKLDQYKKESHELINKAVGVIDNQDAIINRLNKEITELKEKAPTSLVDRIAKLRSRPSLLSIELGKAGLGLSQPSDLEAAGTNTPFLTEEEK